MKRIGGVWDEIVSFENLCRAARRASLGKRNRGSVQKFLFRLELEVLALQRELTSGTWVPSISKQFTLFDPKERIITVAPFRDRVIHHAIIDPLEPSFDRRMTNESFACRKNKGTHRALDHSQYLVRRYSWFLKLDIRKFFDSLNHAIVLETLHRLVKDKALLELFDRLVRGSSPDSTQGLPIGNLTSQWLANLVLDPLDHYIKERLRVPGYVRYMDDFVLFGDNKTELKTWHQEVNDFITNLKLSIKQRATLLAPTHQGLPFLGWRVYPHVRRLRPENKQRMFRRLKHRMWEHNQGRIDEEQLADCVRAITNHMQIGSTHRLRQSWFEQLRSRAPPN